MEGLQQDLDNVATEVAPTVPVRQITDGVTVQVTYDNDAIGTQPDGGDHQRLLVPKIKHMMRWSWTTSKQVMRRPGMVLSQWDPEIAGADGTVPPRGSADAPSRSLCRR